MSQKDLESDIKVVQLYDPATTTADQASITSIDTQGYDGLTLVALVGEGGDTWSGSVYTEFEVEHSDDDSTFTDCADTDLTASVTGTNTGTFAKIDDAAEDDTAYKTGYIGGKRYVRPVINVTGTHTNGTIYGIAAILSHPKYPPAA